MKKSVLLVLASASLMLAACGNKPSTPKSSDNTSENTSVNTSVDSEESVNPSSDDTVYVTGILVQSHYDMVSGDTVLVDVSVTPETADQSVTYESSDDDIATVAQGYLIAGNKTGTATITVTSVGLMDSGAPATATFTVTVSEPAKDLTPISELISAESGTTFATHAYVVGMSSGTFNYTPDKGDPIAEYKYVYIADGEDFLQGYNVHADDLKGIAVGDLVEVEGEISQFTPKGTSWTTPEFTSKGFTKIEADEDVEKPVFTEWSVEKALGTITDASLNKGYELKEAIVTSISTSSKDHTTVKLMIGEETATLYLHADTKDNVVDGFSDIKPGWRISGKTWVGAYQDGFQFVGLNDGVFTEGTLPDQEIKPLADVVKLEKGATFQSRAKVVSIPDKTENGAWKNVFVADGETFYDLYQVPEEYLTGVKEGDYIEFKGVVANYTDTWTTMEANVSEAVKVLDDASGVADPVFTAWDVEHTLGTVAEADVNKGYQITGALIEAVSGSNMTLKIGEESIGVYLRNGSYNLPIDEKAVVGNKLTAKGFMGHNKGAAQFIALEDISVEEVEYDVESVEVDAATAEIGIGGTHTIVASITPAEADQSVTFEVTSGSDYITVSDKGVVTGKAAGEGVVTVKSVKDPTKTATVTITVKNETISTWTVEKTAAKLAEEHEWVASSGSAVGTNFKDGFAYDENITISFTGIGNTGTYWTNGANIRVYGTAKESDASITIAAKTGYVIDSVKLTFETSNSPTLDIESGKDTEVGATSATYTMTSGTKNGQIKITAFSITYSLAE